MKLHILGYGRHGKDTVSGWLAARLGLSWVSSSLFAAERIVYPRLCEKYGYENAQQAFDDRHNHRSEWYDLIKAFGEGDPARFARLLFDSYDIYCGIRDRDQLLASREEAQYDLAIWVDASERHPPEDISSCTVTSDDADIIIPNNGSLDDLYERLERLALMIRGPHNDEYLGRSLRR